MSLRPILPLQLRIQHRHGTIDGDRVAIRIGSIMRESTQCEGVFIEISGVAQQRCDEIAAADVVRQIREEVRAKRVVTHVLDNAPAVGVSMRLLQILCRCSSKALQQKRLNRLLPDSVDDRFMRQNGIGIQAGLQKTEDDEESNQVPRLPMLRRENSGKHT